MASGGQFTSFKRLPSMPTEPSGTPKSTQALSTLRESIETSSPKSHPSQRVTEIDSSRTFSPILERKDSSHFTKKFKRQRGTSKNDIDLNPDYIDSKDKEKSISGKLTTLLSINERKEKSLSNKSTNIIPQLLSVPSKHSIQHSYEQYSQDSIHDDLYDDEQTSNNPTYTQEQDRMTLITNINDNTTDASNNKTKQIFHRKRHRPKKVDITSDVSDIEMSKRYDTTTAISKSGTDLSALLSMTKSHKPSKKIISRISRHSINQSMTGGVTTDVTEYSLKDELNLQKIIINATTEMHGDVAMPTMSRTDNYSNGETDDSDRDNGHGHSRFKNHGKSFSELFKMKQKRNEILNGFEFYFKLRNVLSLLTLIAIGTMQIVYYRYYYLCMIFTIVTCLFYGLLFVPLIYENLSNSGWCLFGLVIIRLFHIMSILLLFAGVETCLWHYEDAMNKWVNNEHFEFNNNIELYNSILWIFVIGAIIICSLQNVYVVEYVEYIVQKWKLIYCCRKTYYINDDGSWRGDINPISGEDGVLTFLLFITTFGAIITAVVCITQMEQDMKTYGI